MNSKTAQLGLTWPPHVVLGCRVFYSPQRNWAINDTGPRSFKIGRRRVWRRTDVLAWIAQQDAATGAGGA
jgi:hypothetical protein